MDAPAELLAATAHAYMLYQLVVAYFPTPLDIDRVHLKWLPLSEDFDEYGGIAWGAVPLVYLYQVLRAASLKGKAEWCCFATLLQVKYIIF